MTASVAFTTLNMLFFWANRLLANARNRSKEIKADVVTFSTSHIGNMAPNFSYWKKMEIRQKVDDLKTPLRFYEAYLFQQETGRDTA
ncbi:hypothetical protein M514_08114 [Trichuris suis]|uniref:Uncharacterized protein n=1 Tax=Trichuris suis TaxID=68888 RepID=A0A085M1H7_9BILA|nr:hypothetical protein M513_08114 [Trichuris suis]KFD73287.1 hypothetical protein M514_08114 [Trichuris suis]